MTPPDDIPSSEADLCDLRQAALGADHRCDGADCVYWRVLEHLDAETDRGSGCAIKNYRMLADRDPEVAAWLLSVKRRVEAMEGKSG